MLVSPSQVISSYKPNEESVEESSGDGLLRWKLNQDMNVKTVSTEQGRGSIAGCGSFGMYVDFS